MERNRRHGFGNRWVLAVVMSLGLALFSGGMAQAAPQYTVACDFCHRMPPLDSVDGKRDPATGAVKGNHQSHAGTTAASCAKCHGNGTVTYPTGHRDKLIAVQGNINNSPASGYYSRVFFNQTSVPPNPLGTCANVNCHFESTSPAWGGAAFTAPTDCARCHGAAPATGNHPTAGTKHGRYYGTGTGSCQKCHPDHTNEGKAFAHATSATNRGIAVRFTASPNSGGTYSGDGLNFLPSQHKTTFGSCTNLYCHSNGASGAPKVVPTWGATLDCKGCHNSNLASGAPMTSGKHGAHINNAANLGTNFGCAECHAGTVSNDTTIADVSRHVKGFVDFSGARSGRSYVSATGVCSTVYCHSDGKGNYQSMTVANWKSTGITLDCKGCHGADGSPAFASTAGEPNYGNGGAGQPRANTHGSHVIGAADCNSCHVNTVDGTGKLTGTGHPNGTVNVDFNPAKAGSGVSWTAGTKACANISCHGNTSTTWGGSAGCLDCHSGAIGNRAAITSQFGANSHHIQGTITNAACYQCHWEANSDGTINHTYHQSRTPGAPVQLVIYGAGTRPAVYTDGVTAVQYTANGTRSEIRKINSHCLGCHSAQNDSAQPFGDGKTPKQYAWDGKSVDARYSQTGVTTWGKYPGVANAAPKNISKAFSAHGNLAVNKRGWDTTNGVDGAITNTGGTVSVVCYDCHNSHGSTVVGTTTSYASATVNGGLLKDTTISSGYAMAYKPYSSGSAATKDKRNAGANLCLDCHLNQTAGQTPWGYNTYGATQPVLGYWDAPMYKNYSTAGSEQRFPYKKKNPVMGGHFGASMTMTSTPTGTIKGLCTPCHDPHGVSPTLATNQQYAVPLLKGTWLTSPYKEDVAPANNVYKTNFPGEGEGVRYHIDQNTFGSGIAGGVMGPGEDVTVSGGLCLGCHPQNTLTATANVSSPNPWKSKNRVHETVKGWKTSNGTVQHSYTCSKCHGAHSSATLPRLMVTNCLDSIHKGRTGYTGVPVLASGGSDFSMSSGSGSGGGRFPGSYSGGGTDPPFMYGNRGPAYAPLYDAPPSDNVVTCHDSPTANGGDGTTQGWNNVTPWNNATAPAAPSSIAATTGNGQVAIRWSVGADAVSSLVRYGTASGVYGPSINFAYSPQTITGLTNGTPIYYQVGAKNIAGTTWSAEYSVTPAALPTVTSQTATAVGTTTATLGANVTANGGGTLTANGTCWGLTYPPSNCADQGSHTTGVFTQSRTGLPDGSYIYYYGYATNSTGTAYSPYGILYTEPIQPTTLSFTNVGSNGLTVNWVKASTGNYANVIVVMRSGSDVNADPVDGMSYTANATFGSGNQTGAGNYIVYRGTGTSVPVTGLSQGTTYFVKVYAFAGTNYNVTAPLAGSQATTGMTVPTVTSPTATAVGSTTATLGANVNSNGGSTITHYGTCWGTTASPGTNCVDQGTNNITGAFTQNRTGLTEGALIYYRGYATNSLGTSYSPDGTIYTEPVQPTNLSFTSVGAVGVTVNWATGSSGNAKNVIVVMRAGSAVNSDPVDGTTYAANATLGRGAQIGSGNYVVYKGTGTSVPVTGLSPSTTYYVKVYAFAAGAGGTENYNLTAPLSGTQATTAPSVPTITTPTATAVVNSTATLGANVTTNGGAVITANGTCWGLTASPTTNCLDQGSHAIGVFTQSRTGLPEGSLVYYRGYATNSVGTGYTSDGTLYIEPTQPTTLSFTTVGGAGMTVNWVTGSSGNADNVIVLMRSASAVNADPVDGTTYLANAAFGSGTQLGTGNYVVYKGAGTSVPVTGLSPNTTYYVKVYAFAAGAGGTENYNIASPLAGSQTTAAGSPPPAPTLIGPDSGFSGQVGYTDESTPMVYLQWNPSAGATDYYVEIWSDSPITCGNPTSGLNGWTGGRLLWDPLDLCDNQNYYWHVKAHNAYGESDWSETWYWYDAW